MKKQKVEELQEEKEKEKEKVVEQETPVEDKKNEAMNALETQIRTLEEENNKLVDQVKRAQAELINYRTRKDKEVTDTLKYCNQSLITDLIPIVDNFERAIKLDDNNLDDSLSKFLAGFKIIYSHLTETLKKFGVEEIETVGIEFDPNVHEALMTSKDQNKPNDIVLECLLKGYKLKGKVIRAAKVVVNKLD